MYYLYITSLKKKKQLFKRLYFVKRPIYNYLQTVIIFQYNVD